LSQNDFARIQWCLNGLPMAAACLLMMGDARGHFGIMGLAGGDKQILATEGLFAKGQRVAAFAAAAAADNERGGIHVDFLR